MQRGGGGTWEGEGGRERGEGVLKYLNTYVVAMELNFWSMTDRLMLDLGDCPCDIDMNVIINCLLLIKSHV